MGAARLVAEIAVSSHDPATLELARESLPSLRHAATRSAEAFRRSIARNRFGRLRAALHASGQPSFGQRRSFQASVDNLGPSAGDAPDAEAGRCRAALGLPSHGDLSESAVQAAYRRAAKAIHPDRGGSTDAFVTLTAARDTLLERARAGPT